MATFAAVRALGVIRKSLISSRTPASLRTISTSQKNRETAAVTDTVDRTETKSESAVQKNWVSYGFDRTCQTEDVNAMHAIFFAAVSVCLVGGGFVYAYLPDMHMRDWAQREGFLELRRREQLGLPLIDRNLIDPSKIDLPSDEELGETEIII